MKNDSHIFLFLLYRLCHVVYAFVLICGYFAVLQCMSSCTQWARFLHPPLLMSMVIPAKRKASLRQEIISHIADQLSNFQFILEQRLSRLWANFNYHVNGTPICFEFKSGRDLSRFHAQFGILSKYSLLYILNCNVLRNVAYEKYRFS